MPSPSPQAPAWLLQPPEPNGRRAEVTSGLASRAHQSPGNGAIPDLYATFVHDVILRNHRMITKPSTGYAIAAALRCYPEAVTVAAQEQAIDDDQKVWTPNQFVRSAKSLSSIESRRTTKVKQLQRLAKATEPVSFPLQTAASFEALVYLASDPDREGQVIGQEQQHFSERAQMKPSIRDLMAEVSQTVPGGVSIGAPMEDLLLVIDIVAATLNPDALRHFCEGPIEIVGLTGGDLVTITVGAGDYEAACRYAPGQQTPAWIQRFLRGTPSDHTAVFRLHGESEPIHDEDLVLSSQQWHRALRLIANCERRYEKVEAARFLGNFVTIVRRPRPTTA